MALADIIKRTCKKLGENNKPTYVVMAIATVKGICRPTFTMMDKTENPETKKYTALREGLTEAIAIPAYWASGELAGALAKKVFHKDRALAGRAEKNMMFIGVCTAALLIIPGLCSVAIKPIMDAIGLKAPEDKKHPKNILQEPQTTYIPPTINPVTHKNVFPQMYSYTNRPQSGLRVGGL